MFYYLITCDTAFNGETQWYVIKYDERPTESDLHEYAASCAAEKAYEWLDIEILEDSNMTEDEYYAEISYDIKEITREEYEQWIDEGAEW